MGRPDFISFQSFPRLVSVIPSYTPRDLLPNLSFTMENATETATKAAKAKATLAKVLRQKDNENTAKFFAAGMAGMMVLFMIFHWTRSVYKKYESKKGSPTALRVPVAITRYVFPLEEVGVIAHSY